MLVIVLDDNETWASVTGCRIVEIPKHVDDVDGYIATNPGVLLTDAIKSKEDR